MHLPSYLYFTLMRYKIVVADFAEAALFAVNLIDPGSVLVFVIGSRTMDDDSSDFSHPNILSEVDGDGEKPRPYPASESCEHVLLIRN